MVEIGGTESGVRTGWLRTNCEGVVFGVPIWLHVMLVCCVMAALVFLRASEAIAQDHGAKPAFDTVIVRNRSPGDKDKPGKPAESPQNEKSSAEMPESLEKRERSPVLEQIQGESSERAAGPASSKSGGRVETGKQGATHALAEVREARVSAESGKTRFHMTMSAGVRAEIFTLANPYRVIIDLPDVAFKLPDGIGQKGAGLIAAFRYGLFADRKGRIVIDATGPVRIEGAKMTATTRGRAVALEMELIAVTEAEFGLGTGAASNAAAHPEPRPAIFDDPLRSPSAAKKPLVLIDPGHGGIDPGAVGINNLLEKSVVLDVAKRIEKRLSATGRYRVSLTRDRDVFLSLDQRVKVSSDLGADLFVSLHADSLASKTFATQVRGATVYTLSERASDEQARLMAEKENASDQAAGIDSSAFKIESEEVRSILFDLMKRETSNFSTDFSNLLVSRLKQTVSVSRDPQRSAAFRVLKQTYAPSVLIELGYLSNDADAKLMRQAEWQGKVAQSIVAAIDAFFDKRTARTGR